MTLVILTSVRVEPTTLVILTSVRAEPTNAACAPSTATSDALNHYTTEASAKKDAQIAHITTQTLQYTPVVIKTSVVLQTEKNIIIHHRK